MLDQFSWFSPIYTFFFKSIHNIWWVWTFYRRSRFFRYLWFTRVWDCRRLWLFIALCSWINKNLMKKPCIKLLPLYFSGLHCLDTFDPGIVWLFIDVLVPRPIWSFSSIHFFSLSPSSCILGRMVSYTRTTKHATNIESVVNINPMTFIENDTWF